MMSEWLTTGQMIDRLQEGEIAKCETGERVKIYPQANLANFVEIKSTICWILSDGEPLEFYMSESNRKSKWLIIPNYVSFEEAMKALQEGKTVNVFIDNNKYHFKAENPFVLEEMSGYSFKNLFEAKWTIEK